MGHGVALLLSLGTRASNGDGKEPMLANIWVNDGCGVVPQGGCGHAEGRFRRGRRWRLLPFTDVPKGTPCCGGINNASASVSEQEYPVLVHASKRADYFKPLHAREIAEISTEGRLLEALCLVWDLLVAS
jgi:hypothetical protein